MLNLLLQTVNVSFYVVISIIPDRKTDINFNKFIVCYWFSSKNPTQTINVSLHVIFALIKLPQHYIPKNNYRFNDTIFFCYHVVSFCVLLVKKVLPQTLSKFAEIELNLHYKYHLSGNKYYHMLLCTSLLILYNGIYIRLLKLIIMLAESIF